MANVRHYRANQPIVQGRFNLWDLLALVFIFGILGLLAWASTQMTSHYAIGEHLPISLDPSYLPGYALRTVLRMFIALGFSLLFTFIFGTWAAKSVRAERLIIPAVDILQAVPVLSFLSITVVGFIYLFPNSLLGPECASIFAVFTAQAWNIVLGFYQSLKTVPHDLQEVAKMFHLSAWQKFWRIEVPFSMSSLLWNIMMSMSASWFFVVVSEAISVSNQEILLPGVGSYIAVAIAQADMLAVSYAIATMFIVIIIYDQLIFRPLITWSEKFKPEREPRERYYRSWVISLLRRTQLLKLLGNKLAQFSDVWINLRLYRAKPKFMPEVASNKPTWRGLLLVLLSVFILFKLGQFILATIPAAEIMRVFLLGLATSARVIILIILSSIVWIPIGVWIGMRPRVAQTSQPIIQILAAFPASLLYPLVVNLIVLYQLNVEIWVTPLMILGTQWYILFNVIAGASSIPKEMSHVTMNLGVKGWQWWRRLAIPGVYPYFITGAITAAGGAWNASIVAEWVSWGDTTLHATGLGEYIHAQTVAGDFPRIALGTLVMCLYVLAFNRLLWQPMYRRAEARYVMS